MAHHREIVYVLDKAVFKVKTAEGDDLEPGLTLNFNHNYRSDVGGGKVSQHQQ